MAPTVAGKKPAKYMQKPLEKPISKSKRIKKKNYQSFSIYIYKLLRSGEQSNLGISRKSMLIMNNFINDILEQIAVEAGRFVAHGKKTTMGSREVQAAIQLLLPGELAKHAHIEGIRALNMYRNSQTENSKKKT